MKKLILPAVFIIFLTIGAFSYQKFGAQTQENGVYSGLSHLPGFQIEKVKGSYLLLHFWAKWCEPCAEEIPHLVKFAETVKLSKPLLILAVSLDKSLDDANSILPKRGQGLPSIFEVFLDSDHKVAEVLGSFQYPETYFVSPEGQILEKWVGPQQWQKPEVLQYFQNRLGH